MYEKKKFGWTIKGILGMVYMPMGAFFLVLGVLINHFNSWSDELEQRVFLYVFGGLGLVFFLVGGGLLWADVRRRALLRRAYEGGYSVMLPITAVKVQKNVHTNGRSPSIAECRYTDPATGAEHVYRSRYLYGQEAEQLQGQQVPVYIDRMGDDSVGFVDVDAVLRNAGR